VTSTRIIRNTLLCSVGAALLIGLTGCASNSIARTTLPEDMIAVRYWKSEDGRRRKEMFDQLAGQRRAGPQLGVMDLSGIATPWRSAQNRDPSRQYPGRLALINPRTLDVTFPDQAPVGARPLSWSADRERLLFTSNRHNGRFQIYELNFLSGEVKLLAGGGGNVLAAAYAPGGGFAYGLIELDPDGEVDASIRKSEPGSRDRELAKDVAVRHIAYSRDGRYVAFTPQSIEALDSKGRQLPRIIVQSVEPGGESQELAPGLHPVFSPDSQWIVYAANRGKHLQTFRVRVDGTGRTAMGTGVRDENTPAISPDGKYVVYVSPHNGLKRLFVKRFDGTGDRLLYDGAAVEWPIW
jgi:dipeptidyl aminopeptidase/acylaminoacyl peptidase